MKKKKKQIEVPEVSDVKLKPILGIQPGLYLTILYAIIVVLILFLVLVFPGVRNYGSNVHFESAPSGAAVYIDGTYYGSTPLTKFVPAGSHTVTYKKPFFNEQNTEIEVPGKVFGTLFFKRAEQHGAHMSFTDSSNYLRWRFSQTSNWALVGSFYERYRYPFRGVQAISEYYEAEKRAEEHIKQDEAPEELYEFAYMLTNNINSLEQLLDVTASIIAIESPHYRSMSAKEYTSSGTLSDLLGRAASSLISIGVPQELAYLYVESTLEQEKAVSLENSKDYKVNREQVREFIEALPFSEVYSQSNIESIPIRIYGHTFTEIVPPGKVPVGNNKISLSAPLDFTQLSEFPHMETIKSYYISSTEVTRNQFEQFLQENPEWNKDNIDVLVEQGKVDTQYLNYMDQKPFDQTLPVTGVSWYAAKAFCRWFESKLPDDLKARFSVRLPSEAEWEYAARKNSSAGIVERDSGFDGPQAGNYSREGFLGLLDMRGNVWEWCENWYFPSDVLDGAYGASAEGYDGVEKSMRGGSWANRISEVPVWRRASHPPHWCSPFVGFRIVLEPKEDL